MQVNKRPIQELNKQEFYQALTICNEVRFSENKVAVTDGEVVKYALLAGSITPDKMREFLKDN